jgi:AcrR family transcriptional regulator
MAEAPLQSRARATEDLLLTTAETLLREGGAEACTIPEVARRSGRSVGAIYRRFADKDALLQKVFRRYFAEMARQNAQGFERLARRDEPLDRLVRAVARGMTAGQRRDRRLVGALLAYARTQSDPAFRREASKLATAALSRIRELLLARRAEIAHPDPETAIDVALAALTLTTQGLIQRDDFSPLAALDEGTLAEELARMLLAYLGGATGADRSGLSAAE